MMQSLRDIQTMLNKAQENRERIDYTLESCMSGDSILEGEEIVPLWMLKKERQRRGTGVPVDLGLSVLWASRNVGAPTGDKPGYYVGWADVSGQKTSTRNEDYPHGELPNSIDGSEHDIARASWAESWRMPTKSEMQELIQQCQWYWTAINGMPGYQIVGRTGNSIFLPAAGNRFGTDYEDVYSFGRYWTAELNKKKNNMAYMLEFSLQDKEVLTMARCTGLCIRPVINKKG